MCKQIVPVLSVCTDVLTLRIWTDAAAGATCGPEPQGAPQPTRWLQAGLHGKQLHV